MMYNSLIYKNIYNVMQYNIYYLYVVHVLLEFGAIQTSCLLHKRLMSKEKGKKE